MSSIRSWFERSEEEAQYRRCLLVWLESVLEDLELPETARLLIRGFYGSIDLGGFFLEEWQHVEDAHNRSYDSIPEVE